ncbi:MAG: glycosyltransferase family 2 protein [Methanobrevibacter arboriphilus]|uniref:Glycosyltransferase family 2 protein n=1 Tax=Methanobrevibacter arboriphilus TaxID=39441 RepID=A0A843AG95_METAZ|nr:glycosyltransferase family 2 protein [Methanobrevibacter arboriphilus]MBF4468085.1 glycosyltransferase family 2 protein [Methanobrevibacter arboriphilus]
MTIKVSVIIPVYNTENYLEKCLDSVINQKLKDIEIICINDGSTDNSLKILEQYKSLDNRILIIDKENTGCGASRNIGMKYATGKYIIFLDSDDWLNDGAIKSLYDTAEKNNADMIIYKLILYDQNKEEFSTNAYYDLSILNSFFKEDAVWTYHDFNGKFFDIPREVYSRFYKLSFLQNIDAKFSEKLIFEDNTFFFEVMLNAKRIFLLDDHCVIRRVRENSIISSIDKNFFDVIKITNMVFDVFKKNNLYEYYKKEIINNKLNRTFNFVYSRINKKYKHDFFELLKCDFCKISQDPELHKDFKLNLDPPLLYFYLNSLNYNFKEFDLFFNNENLKIENESLKKHNETIKQKLNLAEYNYKRFKEFNHDLKLKNKKIKIQNKEIKKQNKLLGRKNSKLNQKNLRIEKELNKTHSSIIWKILNFLKYK